MKNRYTYFKFTNQQFVFLGILFWIHLSLSVQAQEDSTKSENVFRLEVEDIFAQEKEKVSISNMIASVTGKSENTFEVPVGASVITQEDIQASGCLNIPEALRLLPGVLVRETSSGNYDINIRGFNNLPPATDLVQQDNSNTLVMIDNRPIFNYFSGGTFWETLPIDLHDIARIELIRGGVSALYGPNSVTGVINIITKKPEKEGAYSQTELQYGTQNSIITRGSFGMYINERARIWASAHYQQRDRSQSELYALTLQKFSTTPSDFVNYQTGQTLGQEAFMEAYPDLNLSLRKVGMNLFGTFIPFKKLRTELAVGLENSQSLRPFAENTSTINSTMRSNSWYIDVKNYMGNAQLQVAYQRGEQEPGVNVLGSHFDFSTLDINADYSIKSKSNSFLLKPSISYRKAIYDDTPYFTNAGTEFASGLLNARSTLDDLAGSLQLDWTIKKIRFVGAARLDKYNIPNDVYTSYLGAVNYLPHPNHFLRISYAKSNQSPFFVNVLADYQTQLIATPNPGVFARVEINGNPNLNLLKAKTLEVAYRIKLGKSWQAEIEAFYIQSEDFNKIIQSNALIPGSPIVFDTQFNRGNVEMNANQIGVTFSTEYTFKKGKISVFGTWQKTDLQNASFFSLTPESDPSGERNTSIQSNINNYAATPSFYGGFSGYIKFSTRFHLSSNAYIFTRQEITHISDVILVRPINPFEVKSKILLNAKLIYLPVQQLKLFLNIRNILGQDSREYYFTDRIGSLVLIGMNFEL